MHPPTATAVPFHPEWAALIPDGDWTLYQLVMREVQERGLPTAIGGGFAFSAYAQRWRNTKDIDLYVLPSDRDTVKAIVLAAGFDDLYERAPYDRTWIFRAQRDGVIVDVIWAMANYLTNVDARWLSHGPELNVRGTRFRLLPVEELMWAKLFVLQRDRCDWPDLLNVLRGQVEHIDWKHLLERVGDNARLLGGLLSVFGWLCAAEARRIPPWVWKRVGLLPPPADAPCARTELLDRRDWFGPSPTQAAPI